MTDTPSGIEQREVEFIKGWPKGAEPPAIVASVNFLRHTADNMQEWTPCAHHNYGMMRFVADQLEYLGTENARLREMVQPSEGLGK